MTDNNRHPSQAAGAVGVAACSVAIETVLFGIFLLALRGRWRMAA